MEEKFTSLNLTLDECKEKHICPVCGKEAKESSNSTKKIPKWNLFCSKECQYSDKGKNVSNILHKLSILNKHPNYEEFIKQSNEKRKRTCIEKYGVSATLKSDVIKQKIKQTNRNRYGVDYPQQSDVIRNKTIETNIKKYGVESPAQNDEIKNKVRQTNLERYGVENPMFSDEIKEKLKQTNIERYGTEYSIVSEHSRNKTKQTNLERYGVENPFQSEEIKKKIKQTILSKYGDYILNSTEHRDKIKQIMLNRYGVENPFQSEEIKKKMLLNRRKSNFEQFKNMIYKNKKLVLLTSEKDFCFAKNGDNLLFKCDICGETFHYKINNYGINYRRIFCPNNKHKSSSYFEYEIYEWLKSIGIENIVRNYKIKHNNKILEADIFLPDYNLAIEYNGLYWHSNLFKDDDYHYNKWKFFKDMNIDCMQIFENDWKKVKPTIENLIILNCNNSMNNIMDEDIFKYNYSIRKIDVEEANEFLSINHPFICNRNLKRIYFGILIDNALCGVIGFFINDNNLIIDILSSKNNLHLTFNTLIEYVKCNFKDFNKFIIIDNRYYNVKSITLKNEYFCEIPPTVYFLDNNKNIIDYDSINDIKYHICDCGYCVYRLIDN